MNIKTPPLSYPISSLIDQSTYCLVVVFSTLSPVCYQTQTSKQVPSFHPWDVPTHSQHDIPTNIQTHIYMYIVYKMSCQWYELSLSTIHVHCTCENHVHVHRTVYINTNVVLHVCIIHCQRAWDEETANVHLHVGLVIHVYTCNTLKATCTCTFLSVQ